MTAVWILLALFVLLNIGDGLTTWQFLHEGDHESNKLALYLFPRIGVIPTIVLLKWCTVVPFALLAWFTPPYIAAILLALGCFVVAYAVIKNLED